MATQTRVVGSGFSALYFQNKPIAWLDSFTDTGQRVITDAEPVMSLDKKHPEEIATARVVGAGTLTVTIRELWHEEVWITILRQAGITDEGTLNGLNNLADAYNALDAISAEMTAQIVITNPNNSPNAGTRGKVFHNCVITDMADGESVTIGALTVPRTITMMYTHTTRTHGTKARPLG